MPTSTVEDYLKAIYLAQEREPERPVSTGRIVIGSSPVQYMQVAMSMGAGMKS